MAFIGSDFPLQPRPRISSGARRIPTGNACQCMHVSVELTELL